MSIRPIASFSSNSSRTVFTNLSNEIKGQNQILKEAKDALSNLQTVIEEKFPAVERVVNLAKEGDLTAAAAQVEGFANEAQTLVNDCESGDCEEAA